MKGFLLPLVSLLIPSLALPAAEVTGNTGPKSIPELQAAIEAILKDTRTPGAAIAIVSRNQAEWVAGIGKADVAANQPVTAGTLFRLGSISKTFAAMAALQLQEAGRLELGHGEAMGAGRGLCQSVGINPPVAPRPFARTDHRF